MWQGVIKAWQTIQSGLEQQDPTTWDEITRQPLFGNRFLTNEQGLQWGTDARTNLKYWADQRIRTIKDLVKEDGTGWIPFPEHRNLKRSRTAPQLYTRILHSIPWQPIPTIPATQGLWVAAKDEDGRIQKIYHITRTDPMETAVYLKLKSEQLQLIENKAPLPAGQYSEVRIISCGGAK